MPSRAKTQSSHHLYLIASGIDENCENHQDGEESRILSAEYLIQVTRAKWISDSEVLKSSLLPFQSSTRTACDYWLVVAFICLNVLHSVTQYCHSQVRLSPGSSNPHSTTTCFHSGWLANDPLWHCHLCEIRNALGQTILRVATFIYDTDELLTITRSRMRHLRRNQVFWIEDLCLAIWKSRP